MSSPQLLSPAGHFAAYSSRLARLLQGYDWSPVARLAQELLESWKTGRQVFLAGNGGSAGNAIHLANDFLFAISRIAGSGLRAHALTANPSVITCLANDAGYDQIFAMQLAVQARSGDLFVALSGSGNSPNIVQALKEAKRLGMRSYAVVGFSGGEAKALADVPIHFDIDDMQIAEDAQLIVGHMIMQWLYASRQQVRLPSIGVDSQVTKPVEARFLVLGSNSFSGSTFVDHLARLGYDVVAASRSLQPHEAFLPYKWHVRPGTVRFERVNLNHDLETLQTLLKRERISHVVNFAAQSMVAESWVHPDHWMMTNVVSGVRLHELLRRYEGLQRYVHVTTPEVYGATEGWVREDAPFNPSTPYAVSRAAGDMSLKTYFANYRFPVVFTRAANVYGPGQQLYRIVPRTIVAALGGRKLKLDGGGTSMRVFIHMQDVSDATLRIALGGKPGDTYHISGGELVSVRSLVAMILQRLGKTFDDHVEIGPERPGKDAAYMLDSTKLKTELGWREAVSLEQGIDDVVRWAERYREELPNLPARYEHQP